MPLLNSLHFRGARSHLVPLSNVSCIYSLPKRRRLHLDPPRPRRRQVRLRIRLGTLVARTNTRNHPPQRRQYAQ